MFGFEDKLHPRPDIVATPHSGDHRLPFGATLDLAHDRANAGNVFDGIVEFGMWVVDSLGELGFFNAMQEFLIADRIPEDIGLYGIKTEIRVAIGKPIGSASAG